MINKKTILSFFTAALVILALSSSPVLAQNKVVSKQLKTKTTTQLQTNIQTVISNLTKSDTEIKTKLSQVPAGVDTSVVQSAITDLESQIAILQKIQISTSTAQLSGTMKTFETARLSAQKDIIAANKGLKMIQESATQINKIKTQGDKAIDLRITSLKAKITKINTLKNLSDSEKANFAYQFQGRITDLTTLKAKIDSDTDIKTIKSDYQSVFNDNRIFAIFEPKMNIMIQADTIIARAKALLIKTTDVNVQAKLNNVITQATAAVTKVSGLTPANYPAANILTDAKKLIKLAQTDLNSIKK